MATDGRKRKACVRCSRDENGENADDEGGGGGEEGDDEWQISRYERSDPKRVSNGFEQQGIERRGTLSGGIRFKNSIIRRRKRRNVSLS